jgi:hypothetical protein
MYNVKFQISQGTTWACDAHGIVIAVWHAGCWHPASYLTDGK